MAPVEPLQVCRPRGILASSRPAWRCPARTRAIGTETMSMNDRSTTKSPFRRVANRFQRPDRPVSLFMAMAIYIGAVLLANQWATKVIEISRDGLELKSVFDYPPDMAIAPQNGLIVVGTIVFGITFTQRDRVHRAGRPWVYLMLVVTTILAATQSVFLDVSWRIIVASTLAILLSELADTEVFHRLKERKWFVRAGASNAISIPIDTIIFNLIAFAGVLSSTFDRRDHDWRHRCQSRDGHARGVRPLARPARLAARYVSTAARSPVVAMIPAVQT